MMALNKSITLLGLICGCTLMFYKQLSLVKTKIHIPLNYLKHIQIDSKLFTMKKNLQTLASTTPPVAKKAEHFNVYHDTKTLDEYRWLRDDKRQNKVVLEYLNLENKYSEELLEPLKPLSSTLYEEMISRIAEDDTTYPVTRTFYQYYSRTVKGLQYPIRCRIKTSLKIEDSFKEEQLLNLNEFEEKFLDLGSYKISPDEKKIAYTLDTTGDEKYSLFFKNLETGEVSEEVKEVCSEIIWSSDSSSLFYLVQDEIFRPYKLYKHNVGNAQENDLFLYEEKDPKFYLDIIQSVSKRFLFLESGSSTSAEVHFIDLSESETKLICFSPRSEDRLYSLEHQEDQFIILTNRFKNQKYINFYALKTQISPDSGSEALWKELLSYNEDHFITGVYSLRNYIILEERIDGYANLRVINNSLETPQNYLVKFPEPIFVSCVSSSHLDYSSSLLFYSYSSLTTPSTLISQDLEKNEQKVLKIAPVLGGFDSNLYQSERIITSGKVPISLVYRKDLFKKDGTNPLHLYGYGSYGICVEPNFKSAIISLLDRGFVYAIAHVRGGSELGRQWYEIEGKLLNKKNTFDDFSSAANYLIDKKYSSPLLTSIEGRSAGGLLVGATINQNVSLFNAAILGVPFVDVINTMMDETIPLTINEYEEWGNPNEKKYFDCMKSYSPYDNIPSKVSHFPHLLVRSGLNDPRVQYWEPAKYVAKIREILKASGLSQQRKVAHLIKMGSGHFGASGRYDRYRDVAQDYTFLIATAQKLSPFN